MKARETFNGGDLETIGRNAWRKMDTDQREEFAAWILENGLREIVWARIEKMRGSGVAK